MKAIIFSMEAPIPYRSLGAHRISSFLRQHGWDMEVVNYASYFTTEELIQLFKSRYTQDLKFIGVSCNFGVYDQTFDAFVFWVKQYYPYVKILIGGQYLPEHMTEAADYFITGFGENAMLALTRYLFSNGESVKFKIGRGKKVIDGTGFYPSAPMKALYVEYEKRDFLDPDEWVGIEFGRGCKFECPYCNFPILGIKGDFTRDTDDYLKQVRHAYDNYGISKYLVADETFNDTTEKIIKFADATEQLNFQPYYSGFARADLLVIRKEDREHMARMGFLGHFYGVESMNQETSKVIGKGIKTERLQDGLLEVDKYFRDLNLPYRGTLALVVGLPKETVESQKATFKWVTENWLPNHHTLCWGLDIPSPESIALKPSKISLDLPKYGYKINPAIREEKPYLDFHLFYNDSVPWESEHFNHTTAKLMAEEFMNSIDDRNMIGNFDLPNYRLHPRDSIGKRFIKKNEGMSSFINYNLAFVDRYKSRKLNYQ
jgi:hypothetical protein